MSALSFLLATILSICCDSSQDGSTCILSNATAEAMDSTHSRGELNRTNEILFFANICAPNEDLTKHGFVDTTAMDQMETHALRTADNNNNPNAFRRKRKKTNQGMMAMQRKENDTGHVDECMADGVCIKETNKRSKLFVSSPSMTIITPSSIKPASARSTSTSSLCFNCNVKFPAALRFLPKTYCSDEVVKHGTGFATKARHIDRHYTQNRDTTFITNISLPHAAEHEWRLSSIGVVVEWIDTMINNLIGRKRSSDFHTVSFPLFAFTEVRQKDADAFKSASPYHV
eukprot:492143_1